MSKLTDYYIHDASLNEKGEQAEPGWEQLEDKLLREELLPELLAQLKTTLSKVKRPLMLNVCYDPKGAISVSFTKNCMMAGVGHFASLDEIDPSSAQEPSEAESLDDTIVAEDAPEAETPEPSPVEEPPKPMRNKSIGFKVTFPDGTVFHEKEAVYTFIKALQKIGLARIASDSRNPHHSGYNVVDVRERTDSKNKQKYVDGYYVYTNLGNEIKIEDLTEISERYNIGLIVTLDENPEPDVTAKTEKHHQPVIDEDASHHNNSIKEQFRAFLEKTKSPGTAKSYTSTLDNAVRDWINKEVDSEADSVFSYTTADDVRLCIEMLEASAAYVKENDRKHHSMSAPLNQYLQFIEEREKEK